MSDDPSKPPGMSGGAASLRETTKWLVGGVVATAAGVFAGSSLTNLGSLDPAHHLGRLALALIGALLGFVALGWILKRAIAVLTVESLTLRMLADAEEDAGGDSRLKEVAATILYKYRHSFPLPAPSLSAYAENVDSLPKDDPRRAEVRTFAARIMPDAGFLYVRSRFRELSAILIPAVTLAAIGFGLFSWAANPPASPDPPAPPAQAPYAVAVANGIAPPTQPPPPVRECPAHRSRHRPASGTAPHGR